MRMGMQADPEWISVLPYIRENAGRSLQIVFGVDFNPILSLLPESYLSGR